MFLLGGCTPHSFQLCVPRGCSFQDSMCCVPRPGGGGPGIIPAPSQRLPRLVSSLLGQGVVVRVAVRFGRSRSRHFPGCLRLIFPPSSRSLGMPQGGLGGVLSPCCLASQMRSCFTRPSAVLVAGSRPGSSCRYLGSQKFYVLLLLLFLFFSGAECFWLP